MATRIFHPGTLTLKEATVIAGRMLRLGREVRSVPQVGQAVSELLYDSLRDPDSGAPAIALSRVFVTRTFPPSDDPLPADLEDLATHRCSCMAGRCLILMGSCGIKPTWCYPQLSHNYRCIALDAPDFSTRLPMFAELFRQVQISFAGSADVHVDLVLDKLETAFNVFHVEEVSGSQYVPIQEGFVQRYGIRSALGFGGRLPSGEGFAAILFSVVPIPAAVVAHYRIIALSVYLALLMAEVNSGLLRRSERWDWLVDSEIPLAEFDRLFAAYHQGSSRILSLLDAAEETDVQALQGGQRGQHDSSVIRTAESLQLLAERLMRVDNELRQELSMELHDEWSSKLGSVMFHMGAAMANPPADAAKVAELLKRFREELGAIADWSRTKAHQLFPSIVGQLGFVGAVERLAWEYRSFVPIEIQVEWVPSAEAVDHRLSPLVSMTLYRVVQEAFRNVQKHAQATRVVVAVRAQADGVFMMIDDDGVGLDQTVWRTTSSGIGLFGMEERLRLVQGRVQISSRRSAGTRLEVFAPYSASPL